MTVTDPHGSPDELARALFGARTRPLREGEPPTRDQWDAIFAAASAVPDHGYLQPWRFVVVEGDARERLADALAADAEAQGLEPVRVAKARAKASAAPALAIVVASPRTDSPIPIWEQVTSASCAGYAIVLAAQALGLGAGWRTPTAAAGDGLGEFVGRSGDEQVLGWVLLGPPDTKSLERASLRPEFVLDDGVAFYR
jgi:nitroreductase